MIDPITEYIIEKEKLSEIDPLSAVTAGLIVGGFFTLDALITGSRNFYKDYISKYGRKCQKYKHGHSERRKCELQVKTKALQGRIQILKRSASKCSKAKDPQKCKLKISSTIIKLQKQIHSATKELKNYG